MHLLTRLTADQTGQYAGKLDKLFAEHWSSHAVCGVILQFTESTKVDGQPVFAFFGGKGRVVVYSYALIVSGLYFGFVR